MGETTHLINPVDGQTAVVSRHIGNDFKAAVRELLVQYSDPRGAVEVVDFTIPDGPEELPWQ